MLNNSVSTKYPKNILFYIWKLKPMMHWQVFFNIINHNRLFLNSWKVVTAGFFAVETPNCKNYTWQGSLCFPWSISNIASMERKLEAMHLEILGCMVFLQHHQLLQADVSQFMWSSYCGLLWRLNTLPRLHFYVFTRFPRSSPNISSMEWKLKPVHLKNLGFCGFLQHHQPLQVVSQFM